MVRPSKCTLISGNALRNDDEFSDDAVVLLPCVVVDGAAGNGRPEDGFQKRSAVPLACSMPADVRLADMIQVMAL